MVLQEHRAAFLQLGQAHGEAGLELLALDGAADLASVLRESTKMHVILDDRYREYEWTGHGTGRATSTTLERQREEDRRTSVLLREIRDAATQQKNEGR